MPERHAYPAHLAARLAELAAGDSPKDATTEAGRLFCIESTLASDDTENIVGSRLAHMGVTSEMLRQCIEEESESQSTEERPLRLAS